MRPLRILAGAAGVAAVAILVARPGPSASLAIVGVTIIDGSDPSPRADQTVLIDGNRIVAVGSAASTEVPARAQVIEGRGRFLVPGLWDMHVHTTVPGGREVLALYTANGVTGVRDMAGEWDMLRGWRREIARGTLVGPRIVASGPYLEGGDVPIPHILTRTPDEARAAVDSLVRLGVDFVKIHGQLTEETYFAAARAARSKGIPFAGHLPRGVTPAEASDSGQRSLEHLLQIPMPCTEREFTALQPRFPLQGFLGRCSREDPAPLFRRFAANGTWIVPTFVAAYEIAVWPTRDVPGDAAARFLPDTLRRYVAEIFQLPADAPAGADAVGRAIFGKRLALVGAMHRAGVGILAGTDAPLRNSPPGFGLHQELVHLVEAGLTPFDALRAATLEPARYLGMLDSSGTIAAGKLADLVLLEADPLSDIRNLRRIATVVANGRVIPPPAEPAGKPGGR